MSRNKELNRDCYNRIKESLLGEAITPREEAGQIKESIIAQVTTLKIYAFIAQGFFYYNY